MSDLGGDPTQPNRGFPYSVTSHKHTFGKSTAKDGIRLSWWHRKRKTPFGGEFDYTDPNDLTGRFLRPGDRWTWQGQLRMRLRQWIGKHSDQPVAWVTVDFDEAPIYESNPTAYMMKNGEVKISPIEVRTMFPVWDDYGDKAIFAMDGYEETQGDA